MVNILKVGAMYGIFFMACHLKAQDLKTSFSIKMNAGISFSHFNEHQDINVRNKNLQVLCPQVSFNYLTPKKDLVECGIGLYNLGNKIGYYDLAGNPTNSLLNTNQVFGIPIAFYKNIDPKNNQYYIGAGANFCYNFTNSVFTNTYTDFIETTSHSKGLKVSLTAGIKYFFITKGRNFSMEMLYSKGLNNYYKVNITSVYYPSQNNIIHNGSALYLGLTYYFIKKQKKEEE